MPEEKKLFLDKIEQMSRIVGTLAIPVAVAFAGWLIQRQLAMQNISRDYVQLAVAILKEPKKEGGEELRGWAVDLLNAHSPIKLNSSVSKKLKEGTITFATFVSDTDPLYVIAERWLSLIDSGDYEKAWALTDAHRSLSKFTDRIILARKPFGRPSNREFNKVWFGHSLAPDSTGIEYLTEFEAGATASEIVFIAKDYKISTYSIAPTSRPR